MTTRDMKWVNVFAYVGPPRGCVPGELDPEEEGVWWNHTEFLIEVEYQDRIFYAKQHVENNELAQFNGDLYKLALDKMVESIDNYIKEYENVG